MKRNKLLKSTASDLEDRLTRAMLGLENSTMDVNAVNAMASLSRGALGVIRTRMQISRMSGTKPNKRIKDFND